MRPTAAGRKALENFITIRGGSGDVVKIMDGNKLLGYRELPFAIKELHRGAIYLHGGRSYEVQELRLDARSALVKPVKASFITRLYTPRFRR